MAGQTTIAIADHEMSIVSVSPTIAEVQGNHLTGGNGGRRQLSSWDGTRLSTPIDQVALAVPPRAYRWLCLSSVRIV